MSVRNFIVITGAASFLAMSGATACGSKPKMPVGVNTTSSDASAVFAARKTAADAKAARLLPSYIVATIGEKSIGPFWARRGAVAMAAYIGPSPDGVRRVVSVPLSAEGDTRGDAHVVSTAAPEASTLIVRPTGGNGAGFVAAWTALTDRGEALSIVGIGDDGVARNTPIELAHSADDVVWMDIVPTPRGAVCVWAEETRGADANILAVALDPDGKMRGVPSRVARGVTGWQVASVGTGLGLALVTPEAGSSHDSSAKRHRGGALSWLRLDAEAKPVGAALPVTTKPSVSGDIDVVRLGDRSLLAWTDRTASDPQVATCMISDDGKVESPRRPLEATSGSSLIGIAAGLSGAVLAWDEPNKRGRATRRVHLASLTASGTLGPKATTLEIQGRGVPEIIATDTGFAMLASAHACEMVAKAGPDHIPEAPECADTPIVPTFVRLDASLAVAQTEPLLLGEDRTAVAMAWGLRCVADRCAALAASGDPAIVQSVDLAPRVTPYVGPLVAAPPADAPRLTTVATLASGAPFADVAVTKVADAILVATVTSAVDNAAGTQLVKPSLVKPSKVAPSKNVEHEGGATLSIRALDSKGALMGTPTNLSTRALSVGGVAIAPGGTVEDGAAVAWVARDSGDPQVHVTRVDKRGKRMNDVQVNIAKGEAADVAIAWAGGGWIVSWVDWRMGNGEVYATKLKTDLSRVAREERITDAPGDASDVTLLARGDTVWLAWADPRESPREGFADVYVTQIRAHDARRSADEIRVLASAAHSRSPALAPSGDGVVLAWIEEAPLGADAASSAAYGAMLATLDGRGHSREAPLKLRSGGDGFATSIALDNAASGVRAILARSSKDEMTLDTLELGGLPIPRIFPLLTLDGPPSMDVAIAVMDGIVYFNDDGAEPGNRRARRALVQWKR